MLSARDLAVVDALCPSGANAKLARGALEAGFERFYEAWSREANPALRWCFKGALLAGAWLAPVLIGRLPPITRLAPAERGRALETMFSHRLYVCRQLGLTLKMVVAFSYGADPEVRAAVGVPPEGGAP